MDREVAALRQLLQATPEKPAGTPARRKMVAERAQCSPDNLYQVAAGIALKSGKPRRVGRELKERLDAAFPGWLDDHQVGGSAAQVAVKTIGSGVKFGVAQAVSYHPWTLPSSFEWRELMKTAAQDLPAVFSVAMPDDALAPNLPRGTEVVFKRTESAEPGQCVFVEDKNRVRYIRRYIQEAAGAWGAEAINKVYLSLHSERDGLKLLAVMAWRAESRI